MPVGAEFHTASGIVQIDDQAPVLCLRYAGSSTVVNQHPASQNASTNIAMTVDITVTAETPQIFVCGEQAGAAFGVIATVLSGNTWTFRVIGFSHSPRFSYFIFDTPPASSSGAGIEVYDANGRVMFSSLYRPMIVKGFTFNDTGANPNTINLSGSRQYASAHNASITRREFDDNLTDGDTITYWTDYLNVASVNGGQVSVNAYAIAGGSTNGGQGSPPIGTGLGGWGSPSSMTAVDVTGLVSVVTPASPIVSVSPSSMTATGTGSGTTTTGVVTATASGGSGGGYAYQWAQTLTDSRVVAVGPTNVRTLQTQVVNQPAGTSIITKWQCRVTDSAGNIGFSDEVTMTHVQAGAYTTPNPISIPTLSVISNDPLVNSAVSYFQITGINQPISLKFTRDSLTGNLYGRALMVGVAGVGAGAGGPWTYYRVGALSTGLQIDDVQNGRWFSVFGELQTDSGVRTGAWQNYITNLTTNTQIASFRIEGTVDADDNFNIPDWTIDALNLTDLPINTVENYGATGHGRYITGITQPVRIGVSVSNKSGNISAGGCYIFKNGVMQGTGMLWTAGNDSREATFINGDVFEIYIDAQTFSGAKTGQFYTTVTNLSTGDPLGGFWTVANVDTDNNYERVAGFVLPSISVNSNAPFVQDSSGQAAQTLTGFNNPVTLTLTMAGVSGSMDSGAFRLVRYTPSIGWHQAGAINLSAGGGSCSAQFLPGDLVYSDVYGAETFRGRKDMSFTGQLFNTTPGVDQGLISQHAVNLTVDADDNYNVTLDQTPDSIGFPSMSGSGTTRPLTIFGSPYTVTGFAGPIQMRTYFALNYHTVQAKAHPGGAEEVGDGATNGAAYCHVYRNGGLLASLQHGFWGDWSGPEQYDIVDAWFSPGDTIQFVLQFDVSNENETAQINGYCSGAVYFDNLTVPGNRVGSFGWTQALNKPFG